MRLTACVVFLLSLTSSLALANKGNYWWIFPQFDENGKENASVEEEKQQPINGTQFNLTLNTNIELDLDLNADVEYEESANESSGDSDIPKEHSNPDNKKKTTGKPNISDSDKDDEIDWAEDKDSKESLTEAERPEVTNVSEEDDDYTKKSKPGELVILEEKDEAIYVDGDVHPSSKLEQKRSDDEDESNSGEKEVPDIELIVKKKDEAVHVNGDAHPSSKLEQDGDENAFSGEQEIEDDQPENVTSKERDQVVHENGDPHPSSKLELDNSNIEKAEEESIADSKIEDANADVVEEESSDESNEDINEKDISEFLIIDNDKVVGQNQEAESIEIAGEVLDSKEESNAPPEIDRIDSKPDDGGESDQGNENDQELHWVDEITQTAEDSINNNGFEQDVKNEEIEKMPTAVPISPKVPACSFDQRPFNLTIQPTADSRLYVLHGSDLSITCQLVPLGNVSESMPFFRLTWKFQKENCLTGDPSCPKVLTSTNYETQNLNYSLVYNLAKLNHSTDSGSYICEAEIYGCETPDLNVTQTTLNMFLRVYIKPNYAFHIGIISSACVILLALLAGLVVYARKVQARSKSRYQELLATTDIQYYPSSKVLELPNSVYNPTTTGFIRMSASSYSSKSSFTSNEEEA